MRARTVKRSALQFIMMRELRTKAVVHESGPEGALVYRKPSCRRVVARRDRRRRWNLALPHGFNPHRQTSSTAFSDRQAAARRRYWRALHLQDQCGDTRQVTTLSSIR